MRQAEPLSAEVLSSLSRDEQVPAIFGRLLELVYAEPRRNDPAQQWAYVASLTQELQTLWATYILDAEIANGGFSQYFYNSSRYFIDEARQGLRLLGAVDHLRLLERALAILHEAIPTPPFRDPDWRSIYDRHEEPLCSLLNDLDTAWYSLEPIWYERLQDAVSASVEAFVSD